jgi:hypothetical protein
MPDMIYLKEKRIFLISSISLIISCISGVGIYGESPADQPVKPDSIEKQILYNGRAWRNLYTKIKGDPFLFSTDFLPGNVTIGKKIFENLNLKYDIFNDELLVISDRGLILQLNHEMIDNFNLTWLDRKYLFKRMEADSLNSLSGFVNVLYDGNTPLYVKYRKEILLLAVDNKYDMFNQVQKVYIKKEGRIILINGRREFLNQLKDRKQQIKSYIRSNKLTVRKNDPLSFRPVLEYYDKLGQSRN